MKWFVSLTLLTTALVMMISCPFSQSVTASEMIINGRSYGPTTNTLPTEIYKFICEDSLANNAHCNPEITNIVDLNGDGELEIFISGEDVTVYQGSGGWTTWLYTYTNKKYVLIQGDFFGYDVEVARKKTNGYFDLTQQYRSYGSGDQTRSFKWDKAKGRYVENN